jgi:hypothetical protein
MDGVSACQRRDVARVFQVDRHSEAVIATAFERLSALGKAPDPSSHPPVEDECDSKQQLQEARS